MPLTVKLGESSDTYYTDSADGLVRHDVTHAAIVDEHGDEVDSFGGPVSEEWLPNEWDAALAAAGYQRTGPWDLTYYTATVETLPQEGGSRAG
jgi:hypothetical protein